VFPSFEFLIFFVLHSNNRARSTTIILSLSKVWKVIFRSKQVHHLCQYGKFIWLDFPLMVPVWNSSLANVLDITTNYTKFSRHGGYYLRLERTYSSLVVFYLFSSCRKTFNNYLRTGGFASVFEWRTDEHLLLCHGSNEVILWVRAAKRCKPPHLCVSP